MESLSLETLLLLISTDLFITFYFLNTYKQWSIHCSFLLQSVETLYSLKGASDCLGGKDDILGPQALSRQLAYVWVSAVMSGR